MSSHTILSPLRIPTPVTREIETFSKHQLTLALFKDRWAQHVPIVVSGVDLDFQVPWSPEYFIEHHGNDVCKVEDFETGQLLPDYTVAHFFSGFGQPRAGGSPILRLKVSFLSSYEKPHCDTVYQDWPPKENFDRVFPDLLDDFMQQIVMHV